MFRFASKVGFGLIEIMIAIAIVAGAALVVSQFVTKQTKQMITVREKTSCANTVNSILSKMKELDNNTSVNNWLPKSGQGAPSGQENYLSLRMTKVIFDSFSTVNDVDSSIITVLTSGAIDGPYTAAENNIRLSVNNHQLIYSASNMLNYYYKNIPNICAGTVLDRSKNDYLAAITSDIDEDIQIAVKINVAGGCEAWDPLPQGIQSAPNTKAGYEFHLTLNYKTKEDKEESCSGNATFYVGADLSPPQIDPQLLTAINGFNELSPTDGRVFCGPNVNPSITFNVSQVAGSEQPGTQYVCRLDYEGKNATDNQMVHPFRSTGWFLCSIPEGPIESLSLPGANKLTVGAIDISDGNAPAAVRFVVSDWVQGTYKFHVKAIDIARNESIRTQKFYIDISRPRLALVPPSSILRISDPSRQAVLTAGINSSPNASFLSAAQRSNLVTNITNELKNDLFQCVDKKMYRWDVENMEDVEVTPATIIENYHASLTPVAMGCDISSQNIPSADWTDGPHMVQAISCDLCGGDIASAASAAWYVETVTNFIFIPPGHLSSATPGVSRFSYNAGTNDNNVYALTHEVYGNRNMSAHRYNNVPINLPFQNGMVGDCDINRYGKYCYSAVDGCGRVTAGGSYQYQVGGGGGNTFYCPTFSCAEPAVNNTCPAARPYSCSCFNDSTNDLILSAARKGRYYGNPTEAGCQYEESLGTCCRPPQSCQLNDGTIVNHGSSITTYTSNTVTCGQACLPIVRTCTDGVLNGPNNSQNSTCSVNCCPTGMVSCSPASPICTVQLNGSLCMVPQSCAVGEVECICGSGDGCPVTYGANGLCCKPTAP